MAKGLDRHHERLAALSRFGKDLTRRAGSECELCQAGGVKLRIHEVPPVPNEPDFDHCAFVCDVCLSQLTARRLDPNHWRCLATAAWSEIPAVQVTSVLLLDRLSDEDWARELREQLYLAPAVEDWLRRLG